MIQHLAAAGAGGDSPAAQASARTSRPGRLRGGGRRPRPRRWLQLLGHPRRRASDARRPRGAASTTRLVTVGKKAHGYFRFRGYDIDESFSGFRDQPDLRGRPSRSPSTSPSGSSPASTHEVLLAYTQFISIGRAAPGHRHVHAARPVGARPGQERRRRARPPTTSSSPARPRSSSRLLPRYAEARLFAALLEPAASEHACRQRAMKAATENAEEHDRPASAG